MWVARRSAKGSSAPSGERKGNYRQGTIYLSLTDDIFDMIPRFSLAVSPVHKDEKRSLLPEFRGLLSGKRCELDGAMAVEKLRSFAAHRTMHGS